MSEFVGVALPGHHRDRITGLRLNGKSIKEIAAVTGFGKSTISKYCAGLRPNNPHIKTHHIASAKNAAKCKRVRDGIAAEARKQWTKGKKNPHLIALVALYWAEGSKRHKRKNVTGFQLTNSDPGVIKAASVALSELGYGDQCMRLRIMPGQDADECKMAWESMVGLRVIGVNPVKRRSNSKRIWSKYGVCTLEVKRSLRLWISVMTWIDCWRSEHGIDNGWQL